MGRAPCCDKANVKKGPWSPEEDEKLKSYIEQHGTGGNWIALPRKIGLKRCGKSCRLRWLNYLRPNIKHGGFSEEEDNIICSLYISIGSRWSIIASQLPGRTDNDIKNYWNTRLKKKLLGKPRQEPRQGRRAFAGSHPEQEAEGDDHGSLGITTDGACRVTGWPQQPALTYPPIHHASHHIGDEQASMRKPLVEHGEMLSTDGATPSTVPQQQICEDPTSLVWSSLQETSSGQALQCPNGILTELDGMLRFNPAKLEGITDCFYGFGSMVVGESNATAKLENMNWNEVSALMCPNMMRGYGGMQHLGM